MPARANLAITDGETSPITHTFVPDGDVAAGHARFVNFNATCPGASEFLFYRVQKSPAKVSEFSTPGKKVAPRVTEIRILYPATYVEAVSGLTLVDYVDECNLKFMIHPRSTAQRAKNLRIMSNLAMNGSTAAPTIDNGYTWF